AYESEYDHLKEETGLEVGVLDSRLTALGNVICANDRGAVVSPRLGADGCRTVRDVLGVEVVRARVAGLTQAGAAMVANNSGAAVHPEADSRDMEEFAGVLGVRVVHASINNGVPYVASGIIANNRAVVAGSLTTGPEIMMLTRAFMN
ncbi:MAG: translation initiation factor IF-6, partial [Nitrosopumilus sp.]|nr:translation initiation factor IF-6 [Nitrosopumilus sp.]